MAPKPPRRYTPSETLQAVARMVNADRPGGIRLATVDEVTRLDDSKRPARVKLTARAGLHALRRWADALSDVSKIEVFKGIGSEPSWCHIVVTGRIPRGPVVAVEVVEWFLELPPWQPGEDVRHLTLNELHRLDATHRAGGGQ